MDYLDQTPSIRTVIVSYHWNSLVERSSPILPDNGDVGHFVQFMERLAADGRSLIIVGPIPMPRVTGINAAYAAAKTGIGVLAKSLAQEYCDRGVSCAVLCPGFVDTPMTEWVREQVVRRGNVSESDLDLLRVCDDIDEVVSIITESYRTRDDGSEREDI